MLRPFAIALALAVFTGPQALAEQAQFHLEIRFTGCHSTPKRSLCEEGVTAVDEVVTEPFRLIGDQKEYPGFAQAHYVKPYRLRWEEFGEEKELVVALRITREPFGDKNLDVHLAVFPKEGKEGEMRETSIEAARLEDIKRLWLPSNTDVKPGDERGEWHTWASVTIRNLKSIP
jgi:hypothetical protein